MLIAALVVLLGLPHFTPVLLAGIYRRLQSSRPAPLPQMHGSWGIACLLLVLWVTDVTTMASLTRWSSTMLVAKPLCWQASAG